MKYYSQMDIYIDDLHEGNKRFRTSRLDQLGRILKENKIYRFSKQFTFLFFNDFVKLSEKRNATRIETLFK